MKICENYEVVKVGQSVDIVKTVGVNKKGDPVIKRAHYGTVYQALQGVINLRLSDRLENDPEIIGLKEEIKSILRDIENAREQLKEEFCTEVRVK